MNHCFHCGAKLTSLVAQGGWSARYRCDQCGQRYLLSLGDGKRSSDQFFFCGNKAFAVETVSHEVAPQSKAVQSDFDFGL